MNKKRVICVIISIIVVVLLAFGKSVTTGYNRDFRTDELTAVRGQMSANGDIEAGLFSEGPGVKLMAGTYNFSLDYISNAIGSTVEVYDSSDASTSLCKYDLPVAPDQDTIQFKLTFPEETGDIQVRVNYSGLGYFEVIGLTIESEGMVCTDAVAIAVLLIVLVAIYIFLLHKDHKNQDETLACSKVYLIIIFVACVMSIYLFTDYILNGDDTLFHLNRIEGIKSGLLAGQFPVRIHTNTLDGFGYGVSLFYPELFFYIPAILRILGVSLVVAVKIYLFLINIVTGFTMYLAANRIFQKKEIGLLASILYLTALHRLGDGYYVGAYARMTAMAFLPVLLLGAYEILMGNEKKWGWAVVGFTCVFQSAILPAVLSAMYILIAVIICRKSFFKKDRVVTAFKAVILTALINLWFIVPLLYMMSEPISLEGLQHSFLDSLVPLALLFRTTLEIGYAGAKDGTLLSNVMPLTIGLPIIAANFPLILSYVWRGYSIVAENQNINRRKAAYMCGIGLISLFLVSDWMPWGIILKIPMIEYIASYLQFAWRLLPFAILFLSMSGAAGIWLCIQEKRIQIDVSVCLSIIIIMTALYYIEGDTSEHEILRQVEIIDNNHIGNEGEYLYEGTDVAALQERKGKVTIETDVDLNEKQIDISNFQHENGIISFQYNSLEDDKAYIELPILYYPGYEAICENDNLKIERGNENVVRIWLDPQTSGNVVVRYQGVPIWNIATAISLLSISSIGICFIVKRIFIFKKDRS